MKLNTWQKQLKYNPLSLLLSVDDKFIQFFTRKEFLDEETAHIQDLWRLPEVKKLFKGQNTGGSWNSTSAAQKKYPEVNYQLIETWKHLRIAVEQYKMTQEDQRIANAAEYIFSCQTEEGDIRGILANQKAIYYTGAIMSLLIQAGYQNDSRIEKGFQWLLDHRQIDGGWVATPIMTIEALTNKINKLTGAGPTVEQHDRSRPSSHNWTGMVIRAFANHPRYRASFEAKKAGELLKSAFFSKDENYSSYKDAGYWIKFQFPFWWNNLIAAMDSLSKIGFKISDKDILRGISWFIDNQESNGLWKISYSKKHPVKYQNAKTYQQQLWITLAICRIFQKQYQ